MSKRRPIDMQEYLSAQIKNTNEHDWKNAGGVFQYNKQTAPIPRAGPRQQTSNDMQMFTTHAPQFIQNDEQIGFEDIEYYFDSAYPSHVNDGEITWLLDMLQDEIKQCVQITVGTFYFPKIILPTGQPEFFYYRRVLVQITSAPSTQAVSGINGQKYHFEFQVNNINGQAVELVPIKSSFYFKTPITNLTELTLRFMVPNHHNPNWKRIQLPPTHVRIKRIPGGAGSIHFRLVDTTTINVLGINAGVPGIAVFISGFMSNDRVVNELVNSENGVFVSNIINDTDFSIGGIDGTPVDDEYEATMYIAKNRFALPIRFTNLVNTTTNHIQAYHS